MKFGGMRKAASRLKKAGSGGSPRITKKIGAGAIASRLRKAMPKTTPAPPTERPMVRNTGMGRGVALRDSSTRYMKPGKGYKRAKRMR